jgi:hypothetical protein
MLSHISRLELDPAETTKLRHSADVLSKTIAALDLA